MFIFCFDRQKIWTIYLVASSLPALLLVLVSAAPAASASVSTPNLATVELISKESLKKEDAVDHFVVALSTVGEDGKPLNRLHSSRLEGKGIALYPFSSISWSPDGRLVAFCATVRGASRAIYLVNADGSGLHRVKGTTGGTNPVIAPDDATIAFSRTKTHISKPARFHFPPHPRRFYSSTTAWLLDTSSGKIRRLSNWRNGLDFTPGSFSPDGSTLALTRKDNHRSGPEVILMPTHGAGFSVLTLPGKEPTFSPDGQKVAFVGYQDPTRIHAEENQDYDIGELYSIAVNGTALTRLTYNKTGVESSPSWDSSGQSLAYVEAKADTSFIPLALLFPFGNAIREMNADGTCTRTIRSAPKVALYGVAWRPTISPDGPIAC